MNPWYSDDESNPNEANVTLYHGDCRDVLKDLPDSSVDAIVTDPPYGLEFMGKEWDSFRNDNPNYLRPPGIEGSNNSYGPRFGVRQHGDKAGVAKVAARSMAFGKWCGEWSTECLRVLKPGGHLLAFGGTRTWHRLMCAIEDAGFEIRDSIAWLYGSGFPKSLDVSKAIDRAAGVEREIVGVSPNGRNTQALRFNGDNRRPNQENNPAKITAPATDAAKQWQGWGTALKPAFEPIVVARKPLNGTVAANVQAYGTGALNIDACRVGSDTVKLNNYRSVGAQGAISYGHDGRDGHAGEQYETRESSGRWPTNVVLDGEMASELDEQTGYSKSPKSTGRGAGGQHGITGPRGAQGRVWAPGDEGGASRFFPTFRYTPKAGTAERPTVDGVIHPTVKPVELIRWLIRLASPPHGVVLDPFAGSGTIGEAAILEHMRAILIEKDDTYLPLIKARLSKPMQVGFDFDE